MSAQIPGFAWHPADDRHYTRGRTARIRGGAQHYTGGVDSLAWLTTTSQPPVSATFLVRHEPSLTDRGWQLVRIEDTAWTTANANPYTVSIEYEYLPGHHAGIPDVAYEVLARTWADIARYVRDHGLGEFEVVMGHRDWVGGGTYCPDGIDVARIDRRWRELMAGDAAPADAVVPVGPFGRHLGHGFRAFYETLARAGEYAELRALGWPLSEEFSIPNIPGIVWQVFERAILRYDPSQPEPWRVHVATPDAAWVRDWAQGHGLLPDKEADHGDAE